MVESEKNSAWLEQISIQSDVIMDALTEKINLLGTNFPWEDRIRAILKREPNMAGLYISGPKGCGKHTIAACAIDQIKKTAKPRSKYLAIKGSDLMAEGEDLSVAKERLNFLFDSCYDKASDLYLLLEGVEDCADLQGLLDFLGYTAHLYKMNCDDYPRLFLLLISDDELALPSMLSDKLRRCRVDYPSQKARCTFIEIKAEALFPETISSIDRLAILTNGYSYSDLESLAAILLSVKDITPDHCLQTEELAELVAEQQRKDTKTQQNLTFGAFAQLAEGLPTLIETLNRSLESIAANITAIPTAPTKIMPAVQAASVLQNTPDSNVPQPTEESERERISKEGIGKQVVEIFGDQGRSILQNLGYDFNNLDA